MLIKDLKKYHLLISGCFTTFFEALINFLPNANWRVALSPISVLLSALISVYVVHKIKCYCNNMLIKSKLIDQEAIQYQLTVLRRESVEMNLSVDADAIRILNTQSAECAKFIAKLKSENSKIELF